MSLAHFTRDRTKFEPIKTFYEVQFHLPLIMGSKTIIDSDITDVKVEAGKNGNLNDITIEIESVTRKDMEQKNKNTKREF